MALILDTGPLYASVDQNDRDHARCRNLIQTAEESIVIPAPVLVEVEYLILRELQLRNLLLLLTDIAEGTYRVADLTPPDYARARDLCERYADANIGFVDAAVLAIVERFNEPKLATLDRRHFGFLRPRHVDALQLLPE